MMEKFDKIICGDALLELQKMPSECIDCIVTSPPYYALRDYGVNGQIGLEKSPKTYIKRLVEVFSEAKRVLKNSGTFWLNIGDCYAGSQKGKGKKRRTGFQPTASDIGGIITTYNLAGYKNKDLIGIPWTLAFALRNSGWYLRQDIIWAKPNAMPESVKDRLTKSHEHIFLFAKSPKYYFDYQAIMENSKYDNRKNIVRSESKKYLPNSTGLSVQGLQKGGYRWQPTDGQFRRRKRDVWFVPTKPLNEAHFAAYPPDLIKPCILAGCPPGGVVLDMFMGAGTTALVAKKLGRHYTGIELNAEYVRMAEGRGR
jgi:DNA modification methylase